MRASRLVSGLLLVSFVATFVWPPPARARAQSDDCHAASTAELALTAAAPAPDHCGHGITGCGSLLSCSAQNTLLPVALPAPDRARLTHAKLPPASPLLHNQLALAPPTPPPNS